MASITQFKSRDGTTSWRVRIKRKDPDGQSVRVTRTYLTKAEAERKARLIEAAIQDGTWQYVVSYAAQPTVAEALARYMRNLETDSSKKPGTRKNERDRARQLIEILPFAEAKLSDVTTADLDAFKTDRLDAGRAASTVRLDLILLKVVYKQAAAWAGCEELKQNNPFDAFAMPKIHKSNRRERRLRAGEEQRLLEAVMSWRNAATRRELYAILLIALDTGMRMDEIRTLEWHNVDLDERTALLTNTKNSAARTVPLSRRAASAVRHLTKREGDPRLFKITKSGLQSAWRGDKAKALLGIADRAGCPDLRFHDLRHEATSRLVARARGNIALVAAITGHQDLNTLQRYVHLDVRDKLALIDEVEADR